MNDAEVILGILNFSLLLVSCFIMGYLYIISIQPVKKEERYGDKAWRICKQLRLIGGIFEFVAVINLIFWIWFPLPVFGSWMISSNIWIGILIAIVIAVPCCTVMILGLKAAGSESLSPSRETEMYGGIYEYIRHPQSLGEFPLFISISFAVNSWFLVILSSIFIVIYVPIMIHYEEKDLVRRFGDEYRRYQKRTGALFPKHRA